MVWWLMDKLDVLFARFAGVDISDVTCPECGELTPKNIPLCMWCDADLTVPCGC